MFYFLATLSWALILAIELPPLWREKQKKDIVTIIILSVFGLYLCLVQIGGWPVKNPLYALLSLVHLPLFT